MGRGGFCEFKSGSGLELSGFGMWCSLEHVIGDFLGHSRFLLCSSDIGFHQQ